MAAVKTSKRNTPKPNSNRAQKLAERAAERGAVAVARPFEGLAFECDLVAMREFVPSATAQLPLREASRPVFVATVLPGAVAALVRENDGAATGYVGVQVQLSAGSLPHDLGAAVVWAGTAAAGESLQVAPEGGPSLVDVVETGVALDISVHNNFNWWIPQGVAPTPEVAATVERANSAIMPSARLTSVAAAWWVDAGEKAHIRWVRPESEDDLMLALARLHAAGELHLGDGSRFAGSFRTHGLLVPVFDLDPQRDAASWEESTAAFGKRLDEALAVDTPLTGDERRARNGLIGRQVTL